MANVYKQLTYLEFLQNSLYQSHVCFILIIILVIYTTNHTNKVSTH